MWYQLAFPAQQHQQFGTCSCVDNIVFQYCSNLRSLRMFLSHQHRNFSPCSISKLSMSGFLTLIWFRLWCWTANEMSFSTTPSPGFLADFLILLPLFRTSGSSLVWTLVVDCGGLAWPGSEYHRCWTWIPPGGWSYIQTCQIILRDKCLATSTNYELLPNIT